MFEDGLAFPSPVCAEEAIPLQVLVGRWPVVRLREHELVCRFPFDLVEDDAHTEVFQQILQADLDAVHQRSHVILAADVAVPQLHYAADQRVRTAFRPRGRDYLPGIAIGVAGVVEDDHLLERDQMISLCIGVVDELARWAPPGGWGSNRMATN